VEFEVEDLSCPTLPVACNRSVFLVLYHTACAGSSMFRQAMRTVPAISRWINRRQDRLQNFGNAARSTVLSRIVTRSDNIPDVIAEPHAALRMELMLISV